MHFTSAIAVSCHAPLVCCFNAAVLQAGHPSLCGALRLEKRHPPVKFVH
jgi:hypothetical protein